MIKHQLIITFHGSAVSTDSKAMVFLGNQESGKSTTAAHMAMRGSHMLCDDVVPIGLTDLYGIKQSTVFPGIPRPKLLPDAFQNIMGDTSEALHLFDGVDKYQIPIETNIGTTPLHMVCILSTQTTSNTVVCEQLHGFNKISEIMKHISVLDGLESIQETFIRAVEILREVPVWKIKRPEGYSSIDQVVDSITRIALNY